jgi:hypothetical protein
MDFRRASEQLPRAQIETMTFEVQGDDFIRDSSSRRGPMRLILGMLVALLLTIPRTSTAQTAAPLSDESRIFVDVNLFDTANSRAHDRQFTSLFIRFGELGTLRATYPKPSRASQFAVLDLDGGFMLTRSLGFGVGYSRALPKDVVALAATIPHPTFLSAAASNVGMTGDALTREDAATNLFVVLVPVQTKRLQVRMLAGPSFFSYSSAMVQDILYEQTYDTLTPQSTITITGFTSHDVKGSGVGFHVGGDVAFFFTKMFGVTGGVRFSRGTVTLDEEPLSKLSQEITVGGTMVFLGVRARFGG